VTDLWRHSARELAALVRRRAVSSVELTLAYLERIERLNPALHAFVCVDGDGAVRAAQDADRRRSEGAQLADRPLHGVPIAYKDIIDVAGLPTTAGSRVFAGNVARRDAGLVARLRAAGTVCLGKLNTTEFASGDMALFGEARNPWDTTRTTGGSSAGPAGAVAAQLTPMAIGTDTGGSVRLPAAFCGIVGLRPSLGRISGRGVVPLSWTHDTPGPMTRSVPDAALLMSVMTGAAAVGSDLSGDVRGLRLGVPAELDRTVVDPEVGAHVDSVIAMLESHGASVRTVKLPDLDLASAAQWALAYSESWVLHRATFATRWTEYGASFRHRIAGAALLTSEELVLAERVRTRVKAAFQAAFEQVDAIGFPTAGYGASPVGQRYPGGDTARLTRPVSLAQLPALSVPCGFTSAGLPIGVQLVGAQRRDILLLQIGHAYETARGPITREPSMRPSLAAAETASSAPVRMSASQVLDAARLLGLTYLSEADAEGIGASIGPIKATLARASDARPGEPSLLNY
jgi:aspartyl-tRNA(Asn)/glutamyl-tRNA(Gln) amidotransferase subunit A